jgi:energy-coupling factor transport system ATP-binding protein
MDPAPLIDLEGVRFSYPGAAAPALDGLDLRVHEGEFVCVVGRNGSGKSTLARVLAGLARADEAARALVGGHDLLSRDGRLSARRDVGILFQNPDNQIVGATVEEDVAFGLENIGLGQAEIRTRVDDALLDFDLTALARREPHLLSGGQKQRTALAGVLAIPRRVLVLDEPTAMLDPAGRDEVLEAVLRARHPGLAVVLITHDMDEAVLAERVIAIDAGRHVFDGQARALFSDAGLVAGLDLELPPTANVAAGLAARGRWQGPLPLDLDELVATLERGAPYGDG